MKEAYSRLMTLNNITVLLNQDLSKYSTLQLQSTGNLVIVKSKEALIEVLKCLKDQDFIILGWGANTILEEKISVPIIKLELAFDRNILDSMKETYVLPASLNLSLLTTHAIQFGVKGWEVFTGVPATLGGAVYMNAGTRLGEIGELITEVKYINRLGQDIRRKITADDFSYRKNNFLSPGDVIYQVTLKSLGHDKSIGPLIKDYLRKRSRTQPMNARTCGCIFKNPQANVPVGKLIDILNLKGLKYKKVKISSIHGNFIENIDNASKADLMELIELIEKEVYLQFGLKLEREVQY